MTEPARYATKAKVAHAVAMARLAGIEKIGAIELGADGTIRLLSEGKSPAAAEPVEDEIARWRKLRGK